ncbi:MAG: hypothetical protein BM485_07825 [Desulfobulbaceae bacterium DB1]|nr:MAG: hypothetical protein BM485_07825 [Desulfobulbaceae bacterium DB1]
MANILYLVHKMKFDFLFGNYLRKFHNVTFMTSDPMIGLFLDSQYEDSVHLYKVNPVQGENKSSLRIESALARTHFYTLAKDRKIKQAFHHLCATYLEFLDDYLIKNNVDLIITQAKNFLDSACITAVANDNNLPVCYLGGGFFRGESCGVLWEPLRVFEPAIWQKRWDNATKRTIVPSIEVPDMQYDPVEIKKPSRLASLLQKTRYQRNPFWVSQHPDLRPTRSLLNDLRHQSLKSSGKHLPDQTSLTLPEEFVLVPLQGNEICGEVPNPLGITNMECLATLVEDALQKLNSGKKNKIRMVVKEHPARPGIISDKYKQQHPDVLFLYKYPMAKLLEKTKLVVTFNSLAGFEALQHYKPVITFGPLFYTLPKLVYRCEDINLFPSLINKAISDGCDRNSVDDFVAFLKNHFEIPCPGFNRKNPTKEMFQKIHGKIEGILDFCRSHPCSPRDCIPGEDY